MILYAAIMFATAVLFAVLAVQIYKGKTNLIHDYHQTKVTDQKAYGKSFGKAMGLIAAAMALSGILSMFGEAAAWIALAVLFAGLTAAIAAIIRVQKKYNGGLF